RVLISIKYMELISKNIKINMEALNFTVIIVEDLYRDGSCWMAMDYKCNPKVGTKLSRSTSSSSMEWTTQEVNHPEDGIPSKGNMKASMGVAMEFEKAGAEIAKNTGEQSLQSPSPTLGADRSEEVTCFVESRWEETKIKNNQGINRGDTGNNRKGPSSRKGIKNIAKGYNDMDVFRVFASLEVVPGSLENR
ncbi:hypothetical protein Ancab_005110, partial [Ancistrocladus abbreviatus]